MRKRTRRFRMRQRLGRAAYAALTGLLTASDCRELRVQACDRGLELIEHRVDALEIAEAGGVLEIRGDGHAALSGEIAERALELVGLTRQGIAVARGRRGTHRGQD